MNVGPSLERLISSSAFWPRRFRRGRQAGHNRSGSPHGMDFSRATILCLGDMMLDRFAYCDTERISPEAPVPVLLLRRTQSMLGGAGNVARNIAALGGTAVLVGLLGQDMASAEARALLAATPGIIDRHVASADRPTTCKTRYLAGNQQLLRVDEEHTHALTPDAEAALIATVEQTIAQADA